MRRSKDGWEWIMDTERESQVVYPKLYLDISMLSVRGE